MALAGDACIVIGVPAGPISVSLPAWGCTTGRCCRSKAAWAVGSLDLTRPDERGTSKFSLGPAVEDLQGRLQQLGLPMVTRAHWLKCRLKPIGQLHSWCWRPAVGRGEPQPKVPRPPLVAQEATGCAAANTQMRINDAHPDHRPNLERNPKANEPPGKSPRAS